MMRYAMALSGGGARGAAHVGVLLALEEAGLPPGALAGTSAGAVVAGLYACGGWWRISPGAGSAWSTRPFWGLCGPPFSC